MTVMRRGLSRAYACAARPNLRTTKENDSSFFGAIAGASARSKTFPPMSEAYAVGGSNDDTRAKVDASLRGAFFSECLQDESAAETTL